MTSSSSESSEESDTVDFNVYRMQYEPVEHWNLRKSFMIHHWDNIDDEEEILCCAQLFVNIEFLKSRYAAEIMQKIQIMSDEVPIIQKYRKIKQNKLKTTIVTAQDAMQADNNMTTPITVEENKTFRPNHQSHWIDFPVTKSFKIDIHQKNVEAQAVGWDPVDKLDWNCYVHEARKIKPSTKLDELQKSKNLKVLLRDVIIFENDEENDMNYCLNKTTACMNKIGKLNIKFDEDTTTYYYVFKDQAIAKGTGESKKVAKKAVDENFLKVLRDNCYTIRSKLKFNEDYDLKLLSKLGWKGGSLGSEIIDHIKLEIKIGRLGLDNENDKFDQKYFQDLMQNFKQNQLEYDLIFSSKLSKDERAAIHQIASNLNLRTKSYGRKNSRHLVLSTRITPQVLRQKLIEGDENFKEMYELIPPPSVKIVKPHYL